MDKNLAIEALRGFLENPDNVIVKEAILELHPELAESKDEKIRKKMVEHFKNKTKKTWCNIPVEDIISYLEKRKEQIPITESKRLANEVIEYLTRCGYSPVLKDDSKKEHFHIDIPRHEDDFWHSEEYKHCRSVLGEYYMEGSYGSDTYTLYIWRAKKEQDSLALVKNVVSYLEDCKYAPVVKCNISKEFYRIDIPPHEDDFWKSKEYKKCVEILGDYYCQGIYSSNTYKLYVKRTKKEQKDLEKSKVPVEPADTYADEIVKWEDAHPDWDKDVMRATALHFFKLRLQAEWSEEDEKMLEGIIERGQAQIQWCDTGLHPEQVSWLKSLLSRTKPSGNWKPTEEQLEALNALNCHGDLTYIGQQKELISLYHDLKKL